MPKNFGCHHCLRKQTCPNRFPNLYVQLFFEFRLLVPSFGKCSSNIIDPNVEVPKIYFSTIYMHIFSLFYIFQNTKRFSSLFVFPLYHTNIAKNQTNIRQRPTTHFASAAGIFNSRLRYARLRISTIVNSKYSRLARTPQGGPRFVYGHDWHVDVVPVSGVQRIVY